jgi:RNA polymerase sigma-54 factor
LALGHRLELRQGQGLVITPQLQQAIKLLQLSNLELDAFVEAELERNPLLQRDDGPAETERAPKRSSAPPRTSAWTRRVRQRRQPADGRHARRRLARRARHRRRVRVQGAEQAGGQIDWSRTGGGGNFEGDGHYEGALTRAPTLIEHLTEQLAVAGLSPAQTVVAGVLIDAVDEGGYLRADLLRWPSAWAATPPSSRAC